MKSYVAYLLPIVSILIIFGFLFFDPNITGFFVKENKEILPKLNIETKEGMVIPLESEVEVIVGNEKKIISVKEFIEKSKNEYKIEEGELNIIDYNGLGYTGNYKYSLSVDELGFKEEITKGEKIIIKIIYNKNIISQSEAIVP